VQNILIVGLKEGDIDTGGRPIHFIMPNKDEDAVTNALIARNELRRINPAVQKFLLCPSDIPLITPASIQSFVAECGSMSADAYYAVVDEATMETAFPNSKRTYIPFKDGRYTSGDIFLLNAHLEPDMKLMRAVVGSRKNYFQQIRMFSIPFIVRFLLRRMPIFEAGAEAARRAGLGQGRVVVTRHAEIAMDLDKPHHYHLIKAMLEARSAT
jgi:hypothetical protein